MQTILILSGCLPIDLVIEKDLELKSKLNEMLLDKSAINLNIRSKFDERKTNEIYTDGSKIRDRVGCSITIYNNKNKITSFGYRLNDQATVFMSKLLAIEKAINYIINNQLYNLDNTNCVVISDSSLLAISSSRENRSYIINLRNKINYLNIGTYWMKAHIGDGGNERVDQVAKMTNS